MASTTTVRPPMWRHDLLDSFRNVLGTLDCLRAADRAARVVAGIPLDQPALLEDHDDELAGWGCPADQYLAGGDAELVWAADWEDPDALTARLRELPREELLGHLVRMIHHAQVELRCLVDHQPGLLQPPPRVTSITEEDR